MKFRIIDLDKIDLEAEKVLIRTDKGEIAILYGHADIICSGKIIYFFKNDNMYEIETYIPNHNESIFYFSKNTLTIL